MKSLNLSNRRLLTDQLAVANTLATRMKGLLGRESLCAGEGLWIKPCCGVHTFGMKFPIDVVFLDKDKRVVAIVSNLRPNRLTRLYFHATSVLELPAGTVAATSTAPGDQLEIG